MNERKKQEKLILNDIYNNEDNDELFSLDIMRMLYSNNDFVNSTNCRPFEWAIKRYKDSYNSISESVIEYYNDIYDIYLNIINETIKYIDDYNLTDSLDIYAFIQGLFSGNCFSCGEIKNAHFLDLISLEGVDVILGNNYCRHKSELLDRILNNYTESMRFYVGPQENESPNHVIVSVERDNERIFLDSTFPYVFYNNSELTLLGLDEKKYIKSVPTFVFNEKFKKPKEYYNFFYKAYKTPKKDIKECMELNKYMLSQVIFYQNEKELQEEFMNSIEKDVKELRRICRR